MLLRQNFRRRHQRNLITIFHRDNGGFKSDKVLPEPTSPCSKRRIGKGFSMSSAISFNTRFCAPVDGMAEFS